VLLFAVAPQVLYLGRPLNDDQAEAVAQSVPPGHEEHAKATAEHSNHCHVEPKGCAAADGIVGRMLSNGELEFIHEGAFATAIEGTPLPQIFALWKRPEKPPQPA
jgi:hypothetical protein